MILNKPHVVITTSDSVVASEVKLSYRNACAGRLLRPLRALAMTSITHCVLLMYFMLPTLHAQEPSNTHSGPGRTTISPADYLKQKENEYRRQDEKLKEKESSLEFWQEELLKAKTNANTAGVIGHSSLILIPATYYFGGKLLKWAAPAKPAEKFFSFAKARQFLTSHPKTLGAITITLEAGAGISGTYYYWFLSPKEIEELTKKVEDAKAETDKARNKLDRALAELGGRKPDTIPNEGDKPDPLDGN